MIKLKPTVQTIHNSNFFCPKHTKILPGGDLCSYGISTNCIRIGCLRKINLPLAFVMYWRVVVTRKVDKLIVPSHYLKEESLRNGISLRKIEVVPHFTDKNAVGHYIKPEASTILFVGRTDLLKGIGELVNALSLIKERPWKAYIIGTGDESERYIRLSRDLGLGERIIFLNNLDYEAIDEYYQKASMVVFPSMCAESFGLVGIEAMSFGRPVVAFDVGGPREWLVDGETGFLVKRGDIRGLANRIFQLLEDVQLSRKMGQKGQELVEKYYRKEIHLKQLLSIYEEALKKRKEKGRL